MQLGNKLPAFKAVDQYGKEFDSSFLKGRAVVIYFYPKNFTPGCTREACMFRDAYQDFVELGAEVIGISTDSERSHQRFAEKNRLPFILLSDQNGLLRRTFGVKRSLFGLIPGRETFVFDKHGKLIMRFNSMDPGPHIRKAQKKLESLL